ncbi:hypothetical protein [Haloechinothrix salitolerans]|uniref:Sulfotransferase family protein n=1 Tax=Haloechinothrix salitolerans TaxID=926830 RepID=A0ABW2C2G2_9PSEU
MTSPSLPTVENSQRVYLHIGAPKTGTSYLQHVMARKRSQLLELGLLYPKSDNEGHFLAAHDLRGLDYYGISGSKIAGTWGRLVAEVCAWDGPSVISHEMFSLADADTVRRAMRDLDGLEVHIVMTARDLARQIPAHWQEDIKNRGLLTYADYLHSLKRIDDTVNPFFANIFWEYQNLPDVLRRWTADISPERVHIVTAPPRDAAGKDTLWMRFARTVGIDPEQCPADVTPRNPSMGLVETNLLRRLNAKIIDEMNGPSYHNMIKHYLAVNVLAARSGSVPLRLPAEEHGWVTEQAKEIVHELREAKYHVVGDLEELIPVWEGDDTAPRHPDSATDAELLDASIDALVGILHRLDNLRNKLHVMQKRNGLSPTKLAAQRAARRYPKLAVTARAATAFSRRMRNRRDTR